EKDFNEAAYAKKVAQHLGTDHHEHYCSPQDALDVIPSLPDMYDEPFADISAIPTYLVSKFARRDVTVALSGDGGDEMLGGYNRHFTGPKLWAMMRPIPLPLRHALGGRLSALPAGFLDRLFFFYPQFGQKLHKAAGILPIGDPQGIFQRLICQWPDALEVVQNGKHGAIPLLQPEWQASEGLSLPEKMMYWDTISY